MKKTMVLLILFIVFSSTLLSLNIVSAACTPSNPCCCQTYADSGQKRCYDSGICCDISTTNEFWNEISCYNFLVSISSPGIFRVGQKTPVSVVITNNGAYTDSYTITYQVSSLNPSLILVDTIGATSLNGIAKLESVSAQPKVTILSTLASGNILVNVTSVVDARFSKIATIQIIEGDLPLSLPEFNSLAILLLLGIAGVVYYKKVKFK